MDDNKKTKKQLIQENIELRHGIAELQSLEQASRKRTQSLLHAISATKEGLWEIDLQTNQGLFSPRWCEIIGYSFDDPELPHTFHAWASRIHPDDYERVIKARNDHIEKGTEHDIDYRHRHKSGEYRWQNSRGQVVLDKESGEPVEIVGCISDINERNKTEMMLRASEEKYRSLAFTVDTLYVVDRSCRFLHTNESFLAMLGDLQDSVIGRRFDEIYSEETSRVFADVIKYVLETGNPYSDDIVGEKSGKNLLRTFSPIKSGDGSVGAVTVAAKDITARKRAEETIRRNEAKFRTLVEHIPQKIFIKDRDSRYLFISDNFARDLGVSPEESIGKDDYDFYPETLSDQYRADDFRIMETGETEEIEEKALNKGKEIWVNTVKTPLRNENGEIIGVLGIFSDVTARKLAEEALKESEQIFRSLAEQPLIGVGIIQDEVIKYANVKYADIHGYAVDELLDDFPVVNLIHPDFRQIAHDRYKKRLTGHFLHAPFEIKRIKKNAEIIYGLIFGYVAYFKGRPAVFSFLLDVTEQKQAEEALRESEERLRVLSNNLADGMVYQINSGLDGKQRMFTYLSSAIEKLHGLKVEAVKQNPSLIYEQVDDAHRASLAEAENIAFATMSKLDIDLPIRLPSGEVRWRRFISSPRINSDKSVIWDGIEIDVTDHNRAKEKLLSSIREKDILLGEIHHRVKNNLQMISALLTLQANASNNHEVRDNFNESKNRIRAISLIHEGLYNVGDFSKIDLIVYVRSLLQELFKAYNINPERIDLTIQADAIVNVDMSKAIPCGLIMNELISNALKHAFPDLMLKTPESGQTTCDRQAHIKVIISMLQERQMQIIFRDNGVGLPLEIDLHTTQSVGLYLIRGLVQNQLHGQIEVRRGGGTEFLITFPI